jgi:hypothetical protein
LQVVFFGTDDGNRIPIADCGLPADGGGRRIADLFL